MPKLILIDGDPFAYRAAFSCIDDEVDDAIDKIDELLEDTLQEFFWDVESAEYELFLTGKGNFRNEIAVTKPYKGNRKDVEKPEHLEPIRKHMIKEWGAVVSKGQEADDLLGIRATEENYNVIIVSIDKDMLQIPCTHFNPNQKKYYRMTREEGLRFFYTQILTGDTADNIQGLYRVGPVKAKKILEDCETEQEMYEAVLAAYEGQEDRVIENARLLWLRRFDGQIWVPPS